MVKKISFYCIIMLIVSLLNGCIDNTETTTPILEKNALDSQGKIIVAVDPGHGGYDPGTTVENVKEKDINLEIALKVKEVLLINGFSVVMTREEDKDFLDATAGPKKQQDMLKRRELIEKSGAAYLISIHTNSTTSPRWKGAQTFYDKEKEQSQELANIIQKHLKVNTGTHREAKARDFYLTRELDIIGVLVETGFLSNPEERKNLQREEYQYKLAWSICSGLVEFLQK
ncbi:N-acetylmuramoyl-L-alanine amidase [Anaerobranca gottschalkii]|uniref:N-acetylmuramoyl-L-alanine amidase n=1 Tax=Anaerobranca gottschalkii DSM 13577 TaxID=1120990 RepID=A0A1I0A4N5_9FIRM|nr:N-acetylmuramoyl-L-alanine amidase [Anaerobranca gottschalkii]SES89071.1 N-acetylmuramoyl-L-alanine amidase [Anaerobranca gottschalkii DSM 13577]